MKRICILTVLLALFSVSYKAIAFNYKGSLPDIVLMGESIPVLSNEEAMFYILHSPVELIFDPGCTISIVTCNNMEPTNSDDCSADYQRHFFVRDNQNHAIFLAQNVHFIYSEVSMTLDTLHTQVQHIEEVEPSCNDQAIRNYLEGIGWQLSDCLSDYSVQYATYTDRFVENKLGNEECTRTYIRTFSISLEQDLYCVVKLPIVLHSVDFKVNKNEWSYWYFGVNENDLEDPLTHFSELEGQGIIVSDYMFANQMQLTLDSEVPVTYEDSLVVDRTYRLEDFCTGHEELLHHHITVVFVPTVTEYGCYVEEWPDWKALSYVQLYGEEWFEEGYSCPTAAYAECYVYSSDYEDDCEIHYIRKFTVEDACGNITDYVQGVVLYLTDDEFNGEFIPNPLEGHGKIEEVAPANTKDAIDYHLTHNCGFEFPECWVDHTSTYIDYGPDSIQAMSGNCFQHYIREYTLTSSCGQQIQMKQDVNITPVDFTVSTHELPPVTMMGCDVENDVLPGLKTEFSDLNRLVTFSNYMFDDEMTVSPERSQEIEYVLNGYSFTDTYRVMDHCTGHEEVLTQRITVLSSLSTSGLLPTLYYNDKTPIQTPYSSYRDLEEVGVKIFYSCSKDDYLVLVCDSTVALSTTARTRYKRYYTLKSVAPNTSQYSTFTQMIVYREDDPMPFVLGDNIMDVSCKGAKDGYAQINHSNVDEGYAYCSSNYDLECYKVVWHNNTTGEEFVTNRDNPDTQLWSIDTLTEGKYTVTMYTQCEDYPDLHNKAVFESQFEIKAKVESEIDIKTGDAWNYFLLRDGAQMDLHNYGGELYPHIAAICGYYQAEPDSWYDDVEDPARKIWYHWGGRGAVKGYDGGEFPNELVGMSERQYQIWLAHPQRWWRWSDEAIDLYGHKLFDGRMWRYNLSPGENYLTLDVSYRDQSDYYKIINKYVELTIYYGKICNSEDPNEIYGPTGYGEEHMVNTKDYMDYTINFENDPEFATAAASRVQVTCPLGENADVRSIRIGNFGFGEHSFEVPALSNYYNNRINLDSLGFWLDVTATLRVPENEVVWIFQTIDPQTGLAPVDTLGFLPINDTLTGCGEGYVTFSVLPASGLHTGDSLVEKAEIIFDENDVIPTNLFKNVFDAVAPVSTMSCDTTAAATTNELQIAFEATDDEGGSGVAEIEFYVSVDNQDYVLAMRVQPDSLFSYQIPSGTHFRFMGLAVDNVGNKESYKVDPDFEYSRGSAPTDIKLSNSIFAENVDLFTRIGVFTTIDDQSSDVFTYELVEGEGDTHNGLFTIVGNALLTNNDFLCYGLNDFSIRVRSTDLTGESIEKVFTLYSEKTNNLEPVELSEYICAGESYYFAGQSLSTPGFYVDTIPSYLGCDSIVHLRLMMNPTPVTTLVSDDICYGSEYYDNGFELDEDAISSMLEGWNLTGDTTLHMDHYKMNVFGCYDTTRLTLTVHPAYQLEDEYVICPTELPFVYNGHSYNSDAVITESIPMASGCDSTYTLRLIVNPDHGTQTNDFTDGWNWYSTFIDQSNGQGLANLETALGTQGLMIKSQSGFIQYYPDYNTWYGSLNQIDNKSMFMIQTNGDLTADMFGCYAADDTITLRRGWNWIGYPMPDSMYLSQTPAAVSGYPAHEDIFKSSTAFSMYDADYGAWYGLLTVLHPGEGYLYKSNSLVTKYLYYPNHSRAAGHFVEAPEAHWSHDAHRFAENITILGLIELDGELIESDTLEVGVFCNGHERGSGRAVYLEEMDAYRIFLTVHGQDGDVLDFRLFDHNRDRERRIRCRQQLTFHADDHYGNLKNPYLIRFATDYDKLIEAEICEGQYYDEYGFRVYQSGTYFQELMGKNGNDSIVRLDLTVHPVFHEEKEVVAVEFPFLYGDLTFDRPGTYNLPFQTEFGCDSLVVVKVVPYEGARELLVSPVPAERRQRVSLFFPFTRQEQQGLKVEVYSAAGSLVQFQNPSSFPIELDPFDVAGSYMVKVIMGTGEVVTGKIIIK